MSPRFASLFPQTFHSNHTQRWLLSVQFKEIEYTSLSSTKFVEDWAPSSQPTRWSRFYWNVPIINPRCYEHVSAFIFYILFWCGILFHERDRWVAFPFFGSHSPVIVVIVWRVLSTRSTTKGKYLLTCNTVSDGFGVFSVTQQL